MCVASTDRMVQFTDLKNGTGSTFFLLFGNTACAVSIFFLFTKYTNKSFKAIDTLRPTFFLFVEYTNKASNQLTRHGSLGYLIAGVSESTRTQLQSYFHTARFTRLFNSLDRRAFPTSHRRDRDTYAHRFHCSEMLNASVAVRNL